MGVDLGHIRYHLLISTIPKVGEWMKNSVGTRIVALARGHPMTMTTKMLELWVIGVNLLQ
jgi:hypothetical protein